MPKYVKKRQTIWYVSLLLKARVTPNIENPKSTTLARIFANIFVTKRNIKFWNFEEIFFLKPILTILKVTLIYTEFEK